MNRAEIFSQLTELNKEIDRLEQLKAEIELLPKLDAVRQALIALGEALPPEPQKPAAAEARSGEGLNAVREAVSAHGGESCVTLSKYTELSPKIVSMALRKLTRAGEITVKGYGRSKVYFAAQQVNGPAMQAETSEGDS